MKRKLLTTIIAAIIILPFAPNVLIPFPCFKAPCTSGKSCYEVVARCEEYHVPYGQQQTATAIHISAEQIAAAIGGILHRNP